MGNKKITTSVVASLLLATNLYSNESSTELSSITITSSLIETNEEDATYSNEIYTKSDIKESNSKDIYDFFNSQTSVTTSSNFGNIFTQKIDLRGYGIGDGYQNLVVTVNGRRLNNIDMQPQLLSSIPLESIEKIEIVKGSGSVQYGDGANAGAINIVTNGKNENYLKTYIGNNGTRNGAVSLGYSTNNFIINAYIDYSSTDGSRALSSGKKDENYNKNKSINLIYFPTDELELRAGRSYSNMSIHYGGSLSLAQYKENPNQASSFTEQYFSSYVTNLGATYSFSPEYSIDINYSDENKLSNFISSSFKSYYDYSTLNSKLNINKNKYKVSLGFDSFDGDRVGSSNITTKENKAIFASLDYYLNKDITLSLGARKEKVEYTYSPNNGSNLNDDENLEAYEIGINYNINENSSIFANYNKSYQAPDIDRFFRSGNFNGFIEPAQVNNFNVGYTNIRANNKFKFTLFRSNLENEIYYYSTGSFATSFNTNIDKSHKYGIEIYDKYIINKNFYTSINYSYLVAKIDEENENSGLYNGKKLPGVSNHNITLNLGYKYDRISTVLSHTYRSEAYAANDFENSFTQKQEAYSSTDINISYDYKNMEFFAKIQNLFDEDNGLWIRNDAIYPINFERTYYAGVKYKF